MGAAYESGVSGKRIFSFLRLGVLLVMPFLLTGCESLIDSLLAPDSSSGGSHSRGIPLSQAMESSASGSREPLHGSGSRNTHSWEPYSSADTSAGVAATGSGFAVATGSSGDTQTPGYGDDNFRLEIPFDVAYSRPFSGEFRTITRITLTPLCVENDRFSVGFFLGGDIMGLKPGTLADNAIEGAWMLEGGLSGRWYLNRAQAFISPYFSANLALQCLFWRYRNPVFIDGEEIDRDALGAVGGFAGFGVALNRNSRFSFFGEAGVGGTGFVDQTVQGFENDVFHGFGYFTVKAGLCINF
jgi:hypothetical protein